MKKSFSLLVFCFAFLSLLAITPDPVYAWGDYYPEVGDITQIGATDTSITFQTSFTDCVKSEVFIRAHSDSNYNFIGSMDVKTTTYTIDGLKPGEAYDIKIIGHASDGDYDTNWEYDFVTIVKKITGLKQTGWWH